MTKKEADADAVKWRGKAVTIAVIKKSGVYCRHLGWDAEEHAEGLWIDTCEKCGMERLILTERFNK